MKTLRHLVVVGIFFFAVHVSRAAVLITAAGGNERISFSDTIGFSFLIGAAPLSVTQFGVYDSGGDGLAQTNTVGLWDESGTLLGFAGFPPGTAAPLVGEFRYAFLGSGPLLLNANTSYVLGAYSPGLGEIRIQGVPPPTFSSDATLIGTRRNNQIQFSFPRLESGTFPGQAVVGPNMQYTVVPEPCGASLLAFTAIGFLTKGRAAIRPSVRLASK